MQFTGSGESQNVEDRRGMKPAVMAGGGLALLVAILGLVFGVDVRPLLQGLPQGGPGGAQVGGNPNADPNDPFAVFSRKLMKSTEDVWTDVFKRAGETYRHPKMVIFNDAVSTGGCGNAPAAVGPFYCPADQTLYLDPSFFTELEQKLGGSKADFSKSYVVAHEVGHHVQKLLGYSAKVDASRGSRNEKQMSVRLELQADYLAGIWAHYAVKNRQIVIDDKDISEALRTAKAIGDDMLQKRSKGWVSPESYTHGTSEQREKYFRMGLQSGDLSKLKMFFDIRYDDL
jgi:predicted metalloprotease